MHQKVGTIAFIGILIQFVFPDLSSANWPQNFLRTVKRSAVFRKNILSKPFGSRSFFSRFSVRSSGSSDHSSNFSHQGWTEPLKPLVGVPLYTSVELGLRESSVNLCVVFENKNEKYGEIKVFFNSSTHALQVQGLLDLKKLDEVYDQMKQLHRGEASSVWVDIRCPLSIRSDIEVRVGTRKFDLDFAPLKTVSSCGEAQEMFRKGGLFKSAQFLTRLMKREFWFIVQLIPLSFEQRIQYSLDSMESLYDVDIQGCSLTWTPDYSS